MKKKKPQLFYEVGQGKLALDAQSVYTEIQQLALEHKCPVSMSIKIDVIPPPDGDVYGKTRYSISHTKPSKKSILFTTEYEAGVAMREGESVEGLLQISMFPENIPENQR